MVRDAVRVAFDDPRGDANVLRVCAVVEKQVFAEILETFVAEETSLARGGVGCHYPVPRGEPSDALANRDHIARQFVPEHRGRYDHPGVVAAAEHFYIGSAGQGYLDTYEDVSTFDCGNGNRLY